MVYSHVASNYECARRREIERERNWTNPTCDRCGGNGSLCAPYPGFPGAQHAGCTYVDETFTNEILKLLQEYDVDSSQEQQPLFLFWAPHVIHSPLEVSCSNNHCSCFGHPMFYTPPPPHEVSRSASLKGYVLLSQV